MIPRRSGSLMSRERKTKEIEWKKEVKFEGIENPYPLSLLEYVVIDSVSIPRSHVSNTTTLKISKTMVGDQGWRISYQIRLFTIYENR